MSAASFEKSRLELVGTLQGHSIWVTSVSFSPDGTKVASGSGDETVKLWDVMSGSELRSFEGHSSFVRSVSFSPDGSKLLTASEEVIVYQMPSTQQWKLRLALQLDRLDLLHSVLNSF